MLVEGFTTSSLDKGCTGLVKVDTNFLHKKGILVAKALVCPSDGSIPICIANPYEQNITLNKHTIIATYETLEQEDLPSVNTTIASENDQNPCSISEVPEHLKTLYSESCLNLDSEQQAKFPL